MFNRSRLGRAVRAIATATSTLTALLVTTHARADLIGPPRPPAWAPTPLFATAPFHDKASAMCLGAVCALPRAVDVDVDPKTAGTAGGKRLVEGLGPVAVAALALFASPVPKRSRAMAMAVSPMFALGGAGLELRVGWW